MLTRQFNQDRLIASNRLRDEDKNMRVLMLGWELPPMYAGGVGVVCDELARALTKKGVEVTFVMPSGPNNFSVDHIKKLLIANNLFSDAKIKIRKVDSLLSAYQTSEQYANDYKHALKFGGDSSDKALYGKNMLEEVYRFAAKVALIAEEEEFDVIHAHDWTTVPAAIAAKNVSGKPLIDHVHITEFDKSGGLHANSEIYKIEKMGMDQADRIIAISHLIKNRCINHYFADPNKIRVVHNAATTMDENYSCDGGALKEKDKIVLYAGRVTIMKGPDYFVDAANLVLQKNPNVTFIIAGAGDMLVPCIEKAAQYGISHKFIFHGFYNLDEREKFFSMADVFVMPSVSEPFGVVPFEAQIKNTPCIISKQSGISEILNHCIKIDFWDVKKMASNILALLQYPTLNKTLTANGYHEAKSSTWDAPAQNCINIYQELCN